jgi:hypothetical protein
MMNSSPLKALDGEIWMPGAAQRISPSVSMMTGEPSPD